MPIDPKKIEEWRAAEAKATPGPWRETQPDPQWIGEGAYPGDRPRSLRRRGIEGRDRVVVTKIQWPSEHDRAFILAARSAVPALLSEREEMLSVLREVDALPMCPLCGGPREYRKCKEPDKEMLKRAKAARTPKEYAALTRDAEAELRTWHAPDCRLAALLPPVER